MEILYYFSTTDGSGGAVRSLLESFAPRVRLQVFRSWEPFAKELLRPRERETLVVLLISRKEELLDAVSLRDLIHEYKSVLVLPDMEEGTVSLGHSLRPSFMTEKGGDFHELESVLKKMLHNG
jgi:hypothetical protein